MKRWYGMPSRAAACFTRLPTSRSNPLTILVMSRGWPFARTTTNAAKSGCSATLRGDFISLIHELFMIDGAAPA
jgi:hypothetical protein